MKDAQKKVDLPEGIIAKDLKYPSYESKDQAPKELSYEDRQFEMWNVPGFGWCIPTLFIRGAGRRQGVAPRSYAVRVDDGKVCRIGLGPHVKARITVYVRISRLPALKKFIELRRTGAQDANQIRDRISTRRAQGALRRGMYW